MNPENFTHPENDDDSDDSMTGNYIYEEIAQEFFYDHEMDEEEIDNDLNDDI